MYVLHSVQSVRVCACVIIHFWDLCFAQECHVHITSIFSIYCEPNQETFALDNHLILIKTMTTVAMMKLKLFMHLKKMGSKLKFRETKDITSFIHGKPFIKFSVPVSYV